MSFGIVTGFTGAEHITSGDWKALNAGLAGSGNYVLSVGNKLAATLQTANKLRLLDGYGMMAGCQFGMPAGEYVDLVIENGAQGYNRVDLAVARYTRNSTTGIENVSLLVIKGTATTGTASMPSYNSGSVVSGATCDFPLYKISLSGLTPTVTPLFDVLVPAKDAWDSISQNLLWDGVSGKTGQLDFAKPLSGYSALRLDLVDDDGTYRSALIPAKEGTWGFSFTYILVSSGSTWHKSVIGTLSKDSMSITGQRVVGNDGSGLADVKVATILSVHGVPY